MHALIGGTDPVPLSSSRLLRAEPKGATLYPRQSASFPAWRFPIPKSLPTGRVCRGVELDPLYVDVIIRRYEAATGDSAVLIETGESFRELAERRELK